jgi:REP element-mobilizing transposase RayT
MARSARVKADGAAYYHVVSRVANRAFLFGDAKRKGRILDFLRRSAEFSGVDVVTYALMDNHIHLCVRVPERSAVGAGDKMRCGAASDGGTRCDGGDREGLRCYVSAGEVVRRVGVLYGTRRREALERDLAVLRREGRLDEAEDALERYRRRMGDLSEFMKTFKQRVSQWYNGEAGHEGTLWEGRFKSVLIEGGEYLRAVVNYIHMNPVRAKIVSCASQYAWSALGAATAGDAFALKGLSLAGVGMEGLSPQETGVRDRRLTNGVILGSLEFVRRFGAMFAFGMGRRGRRIVSFSRHGTELYATHGQHSAPKVA